jgi:putative ABC transport system ATP-binding protein
VSFLELRKVEKAYGVGAQRVDAVRGVDLVVPAGAFVALVGPSGCGKSSLLHVCGAMDRATSGTVLLDGQDLRSLDDGALTRLRRSRIGFVFQFFNLLPTLSVEENVALPLRLGGVPHKAAVARAAALVDRVGLAHRAHSYPQQLSGGEMQRTALARAVVHRPALVVADEPTGNLDSTKGAEVLQLLLELNRELGATVLLATHAPEVAAVADRTVHMRDGRIARVETRAASPSDPAHVDR